MTSGTYKSRALIPADALNRRVALSPIRRFASIPAGVPEARGPWFRRDSATLRTDRRREVPGR
jgi:hypothetical protein